MKLAIVGRPNVGKSSLFNRICKKRVSIVTADEGVTRDRIYFETDFFGKKFEIIDTGGIVINSKENFLKEILFQANVAIEEADVIIMVVDGKVGLTLLDKDISKILIKSNKKIVLAINKIDDLEREYKVEEFYSLGIKSIIKISSLHGYGIEDLLEKAFEGIDEKDNQIDCSIKIAILGKPNVGKSTFLNYLLKEKRAIVSKTPGTTRDCVDSKIEINGNIYNFIDTAGIKRKNKEKDIIGKFSYIRTMEAVKRADICILMIDAIDGISNIDKKILSYIKENGRDIIYLINKCDLLSDKKKINQWIEDNKVQGFLASAKTGENIDKIFYFIEKIRKMQNTKIPTSELNRFMDLCIKRCHPTMIKGKRLKIYYLTQIGTAPLKFLLFVNNPFLFENSYKKYLINQFKKMFSLEGVSLFFNIKKRI